MRVQLAYGSGRACPNLGSRSPPPRGVVHSLVGGGEREMGGGGGGCPKRRAFLVRRMAAASPAPRRGTDSKRRDSLEVALCLLISDIIGNYLYLMSSLREANIIKISRDNPCFFPKVSTHLRCTTTPYCIRRSRTAYLRDAYTLHTDACRVCFATNRLVA